MRCFSEVLSESVAHPTDSNQLVAIVCVATGTVLTRPESTADDTDSGSTIDLGGGAAECDGEGAKRAVGEEPKSRVRVRGLWHEMSILDTDLVAGGGVSGGSRKLD